MTLRLKGSNSGDVSLKAPATAGNNTFTLPTSNGSAEQFLKNSGTAGTLEFSSMVETSTGVGIGTSSPGRVLHLQAASSTAYSGGSDSADYNFLKIENTTNDKSAGIFFQIGGNGEAAITATEVADGNTDIAFQNRGGGVRSEKARLNSSGRFLIGTATAPTVGSFAQTAKLVSQGNTTESVGGAVLSLQRGEAATAITAGEYLGNICFTDSAGSEFARIDGVADGAAGSSDYPGRLAFSVTADGESSPIERIRVKNDGNTLMRSSTSNGVLNLNSAQSASESSNGLVVQHSATSITGGTASCIIFTNGNIKNTNNFYGSLSDAKLKENIVDASSQWDDIKAIQVRNYNFKESTGQQTHRQLGVVAQELEAVSPGLVSDSPDRDEEGNDLGTVTKSVNYSVLYMKAVKALQEAQTRIETLETQNTAQQTQIDDLLARVTALEAA